MLEYEKPNEFFFPPFFLMALNPFQILTFTDVCCNGVFVESVAQAAVWPFNSYSTYVLHNPSFLDLGLKIKICTYLILVLLNSMIWKYHHVTFTIYYNGLEISDLGPTTHSRIGEFHYSSAAQYTDEILLYYWCRTTSDKIPNKDTFFFFTSFLGGR